MLSILSRLAAPAKTQFSSLPHRSCTLQIRKMGFGSHVSDNDPDRIAKAAAAAAEGHVPSRVPTAPHWCEELASDSEAAVKAEINARQVTPGEAVAMAARGEAVPPGGVILVPGQPVGEDIASLREHTVRILAEEAFVERVVYVAPTVEEQERKETAGKKKEEEKGAEGGEEKMKKKASASAGPREE